MPKRNSDRPLTDLQKIDITKRHLTRRMTQTLLAQEYGVSLATIGRVIEKVLTDGWLSVSITENYPFTPKLRPELMETITGRYHGIQNAYVLEAPEQLADYDAWSDHVHHVLGRYLGGIVKPSICSGDTIGVSSGRGVYYTIEGIFADLIRAEDVTILSLTGSFENRAHGLREPAIMDGDTNAALLALGFGRLVKLQTVGRELVVDASASRPPWFRQPFNRALVGLGILEKTNRILRLKGLQEPLQELGRLVDEDRRDGYIACADMSNCMLWVPPPKGVVIQHERAIRGLIEQINARLCVIPFERLLEVPSCWLAVGTARKAHALHHCLESGLRINSLCVDSTLAEELLKISA